MKEIPLSIDPCPIVEAVVELRFNHNTHDDAVFGMFFAELKNRFSAHSNLPLRDFPQEIVKGNPEFKYKALHQLRNPKNDNFFVNLGPHVISIISKGKYLGWKQYAENIYYVIERIKKTSIITEFSRLGIRYMNFFEGDILDQTELKITLKGKEIESNWSQILYEYNLNGYKNRINVWNDSILEQLGEKTKGTLIDIDTVYANKFSQKEISALLEEGHTTEKKIFYMLLKTEFVKQNLSPKFK